MPLAETGYQLLLIEDDVRLADAIDIRFTNAGFRVLRVPTGTAGLELATNRIVDLLMLDLKLPDIRGEEVLKRLRGQSNLPVLIISSERDEQSKISGLNLGADGYVTKPFSLKELEAYVRAILRRSTVCTLSGKAEEPQQPHARLQCHGVEIILSSREAYVDEESVELSRTEFDLLRYFMEHAGVAITAEQLLAGVWGYNGYDRHIVETSIYRLRRKIEDDATAPERLVTLRGYGYKFTPVADAEAPPAEDEDLSTTALAEG